MISTLLYNRRTGGQAGTSLPCLSLVISLPALVLSAIAADPARAQYPDTYTIPRGALRVSFEPWYLNAKSRFDASGTEEPYGTDLTRDSAGVNFFPSLAPVETAIQSIIDDDTYSVNAGDFLTIQEADVRRFPFNFQFGISDRLTLLANIPVVTTRSQVTFTVDSTNSEMGWNQVAADAANASAINDVVSLLGELEASAAAVEATINGGGYDCPSGPQCTDARNLVDHTRGLRDDLIMMTGVFSDGTLVPALPPFSPLATSTAGAAVLAVIQGTSDNLVLFGAPAVATALPLPEGKIGNADANSVLTSSVFGYDAAPLDFVKYKEKLGDVELGLRWGLTQGSVFRTVLSTIVRLPTGFRDLPGNFVDIGTGDKQTDIQVGIDGAFEPGSIASIAFAAHYNLQLSDQLPRRVTSHDKPIQLSAYELTVSRNLGDIARLAAFPAVRLARGFAAFGSVDYYWKDKDRYSWVEQPSWSEGGPTVQELEFETLGTQLNVGGGLSFRSLGRRPGTLPVEAGLMYQVSYRGKGGLTPKARSMNFYLRLFFRLFGDRPTGMETEDPPAEEVPTPGRW